MKGLGIAMVVVGGLIIYWSWSKQDLSSLPNTPLPPNGGAPTTMKATRQP